MKKKLLTVLASIGLSLSLFIGNVFAAGIGLTSTSYGTYYADVFYPSQDGFSFAYSLFGVNIPITTGSGFTLVYDFKGPYTGDITVGVTGSTTWVLNGCHISVEGGYIKSFPTNINTATTTKTFTIHVDHSDGFTFTLVSNNTNTFANSSVSLAFSYNNMVSETSLAADVDDIRNQIDLYLPGMSTSLSNIATNTSTMASDIATLKSYLDGVEGYIDQLEGYMSNLLRLTNLNIPQYAYAGYYQMSRFGDISYNYWFSSSPPYTSMGLPVVFLSRNSGLSYGSQYEVCIFPGETLHFIYAISYWSSAFTYVNNSNEEMPDIVNKQIQNFNNFEIYDLSYTNNSNSNVWVTLANTVTGKNVIPYYFGTHLPSEVADMYGLEIDNTYTNLLKSLISAVGTISLNQTIVNQNNTNITNNDTYQTQIQNVTNNYYTDYNTYNTSIENDNVFDFSGVSSDGISTYHSLFATIWGFDLVRWPILIILLGFILLVVLG